MITAVNQNVRFQVDQWTHRLLRWCASSPCLVCREPGGSHPEFEGLCAECQAGLPWNQLPVPSPKHITELYAACLYTTPIDRLLPRFKFHHDLAAGRLLAHLMLHALRDVPRPDALLAVPLHSSRLRRRGYDQALELARPLARALYLPLLTNALTRTREHLTPTDAAIVRFRRAVLAGAKALTDGKLPQAPWRHESYRLRSGSWIADENSPFEAIMQERFGNPTGQVQVDEA